MTVGGTTITSQGDTDVYILKLDASGQPLWIMGMGGAGPDRGRGVAAVGSTAWVTGGGGSFTVPTVSGPVPFPRGGFLLRLSGVRTSYHYWAILKGCGDRLAALKSTSPRTQELPPAPVVGNVVVKGLLRKTVKVLAGRTRTLRAKLTNKGNTTVAGGTFELVPADPALVTLLPVRKGVTAAWTAAIDLKPKQSMKYVAKVQFGRCAPAGTTSFATMVNGQPGPAVMVRG